MREIGLEDAAAQFVGRGSNPVNGTDYGIHQLVDVERATVGQLAFGERPYPLVGVEVGSVGGKVLDMQTRVSAPELGERQAVVSGGVVQENDDGTAEVAQKFAEKEAHFFLTDVIEEEQVVKAQVLALGAECDTRDHRDLVAASLAMTLEGSRALGRPSPDHQGRQQKARFIRKD